MSKYFRVGLLLSGVVGWALLGQLPLSSAESVLNRFDISTRSDTSEVQIILYTDRETTYRTRQQGNRFAIDLDDTQLSQRLLDNGLPVVIDNENRFIGRAVPGKDGNARIIIPNLSGDHYKISVVQRPRHTTETEATTVAAAPKPAVKPLEKPLVVSKDNALTINPALKIQDDSIHPAVAMAGDINPALRLAKRAEPPSQQVAVAGAAAPVSETSALQPRDAVDGLDSRFESIASRFAEKPESTGPRAADNRLTLSPSPVRTAVRTIDLSALNGRQPMVAGSVPIWNPYVDSGQKLYKSRTVSRNGQPVSQDPSSDDVRDRQLADAAPVARDAYDSGPINTLSVADSRVGTGTGGQSPDWYLDADGDAPANLDFPIINLPDFTGENIPEPGISANGGVSGEPAGALMETGLLDELKALAAGLPWWVYFLGALFFGGIGLFALLGAALILKMLLGRPAQPVVAPVTASAGAEAPRMEQPQQTKEKAYATAPVRFEDTSGVKPARYLKSSPADVKEAVHNTVLQFPGARRRRTPFKKVSNFQVL